MLFSVFGFSQTVTNNFEDGNWLYYHNRCWGIGENNELEYFTTKVTGNGFNGTDVCETDNLGHTNICRLESPWLSLKSGNITFDHAVPAYNGTRILRVYIVDQSNHATRLFNYTYANSNAKSASIPTVEIGIYKVRWEWTGNDGRSRGQLDNIVIPATNISDPSRDCQVYIPPTPPDTLVNYYPATDTSTLAFEDLWPDYGDYDMNDLVMGYKFKIVSYTQTHYVKDVYATFIVRAQGAGLLNGFGFQLPTVNPSSILSVTGVGDQLGYDIASNGTEIGNSKAVFIIFDDAHKFMSSWNTVKGETPCPAKTFNVHIKFSIVNGVTLQQLNIQTWNPFIIKNSVRGQEIHLPDYVPTDLADITLFGKGSDDTKPEIGKYYKSPTNLPWAIDIYGKFNYPIETADVSKTYLHFGDWAENSGQSYQDWWLTNNSDYRNTSLIY